MRKEKNCRALVSQQKGLVTLVSLEPLTTLIVSDLQSILYLQILLNAHFRRFVALHFDEDASLWVGNFYTLEIVVFDRSIIVKIDFFNTGAGPLLVEPFHACIEQRFKLGSFGREVATTISWPTLHIACCRTFD